MKLFLEDIDYEDFLDELQELTLKVEQLPMGLVKISKMPGRGNYQAFMNCASRGSMSSSDYRKVAEDILTACDMVDKFNQKWARN